MNTYDMLCDEYSVEWGLWLAAEPATGPTPSVTADIAVADEIARLQDQRDALRSGLDEVRAIVSAAKLEHPRLRHLVIGNLADQVRALVDLAITNLYSEEHIRARIAEANAEQLMSGQKRIIAAAKAAGFEYKVTAERGVHFEEAKP
ncbi:MAG: hypothetical protein M5U29_07560 [Anaerolineae bacterium]|nr:hypothetical protein [Anaerolineae bacterium]